MAGWGLQAPARKCTDVKKSTHSVVSFGAFVHGFVDPKGQYNLTLPYIGFSSTLDQNATHLL